MGTPCHRGLQRTLDGMNVKILQLLLWTALATPPTVEVSYCIATKFVGELNLVVWQINRKFKKSANTNFMLVDGVYIAGQASPAILDL